MRIDVVHSGMDETKNEDGLCASNGGVSLVGSRRMLFEKIVTDLADTSSSSADRRSLRNKNRVSRVIDPDNPVCVNNVVHTDDVESAGRSSAENHISRSSLRVSIRTLPLNDRAEINTIVSSTKLPQQDDDDDADVVVCSELSDDLSHERMPPDSVSRTDLVDCCNTSQLPSSSPSLKSDQPFITDTVSSLLEEPPFAKRASYHHAVSGNTKLLLSGTPPCKVDAKCILQEEPTVKVECDSDAAPEGSIGVQNVPQEELLEEEGSGTLSTDDILENEPTVVKPRQPSIINEDQEEHILENVSYANETSAIDIEINNSASDSTEDVTNVKDLISAKCDDSDLISSRNIRESNLVSVEVTKTPDSVDYPDELNPFGDDDEEGSVEEQLLKKVQESLNPFGSDYESDADDNSQKTSTNPFGSDSDSGSDIHTTSQRNNSLPKTPIPLPRYVFIYSIPFQFH